MPKALGKQHHPSVRSSSAYISHVNPQWVRLLDALQMNVQYRSCLGAELFTCGGARILDFLSGYGVHNAGHNNPRIVEALQDELNRDGPVMLQSNIPELAGQLAERLCALAGGRINKAFFCSSGSEGIEAAIKFARARTGRKGLLSAKGAFHGLTCGALSLMGNPFWSERFGPMLPETEQVAFGDLPGLEKALRTKRFAAFFVEPVQGEGGVIIPDVGYLKEAAASCRRYESLLVLDEVQTGMYRTGRFLAAHHFGVEPDMIVLAKSLSGGLVPSAAVLMTDSIYESVYSSLRRAIIHTSTFSENNLSMRAGLATLDVLHDDRLGEHAISAGDYLRMRLRESLSGLEMLADIRGLGLLTGIELRPPRQLKLRAFFEAFRAFHPGVFGQALVRRLFLDHAVLAQMCGNDWMTLKAAPPLVISDAQIDEFVAALKQTLEMIESSTGFWTEALGIARRAVNI